ncbi:hypothetical protein FHS83_001732 [Rhizomicrobium palustre]|uniref:Uncharacterized protein n=1 Tax=Rhizomicrobium palustre TaxID=189966 RepID=A0A846MXT6_9PROT|nr:hypothetical protein [Rhizomicrobium palustre]NIK88414.1 hypothetical protein [Rhizomicrobium palustre]
MQSRNWVAGTSILALCGAAAIACGPFFPWQLLDDRQATLKATPANSFDFEAAHIAAPKDKLKAVETVVTGWSFSAGDERAANAARELAAAESAGLPQAQKALLKAVRASASGAEALSKGQGLPQAILHYAAGAVAYHKSDADFAAGEFSQILGLPAHEAQSRIVWAHFMLGKLAAERDDPAAAAGYFEKTRAAAKKGAPDPLGLAVASFGEEARLHLRAAEVLLEGGSTVSSDSQLAAEATKYRGRTLPAAAAPAFAKEIEKAVALYAEQAARGSNNGTQSLRLTAELLLDAPDRMKAVAHLPQAQEIMVAYALRFSSNPTGSAGGQHIDNVRLNSTWPEQQQYRSAFKDLTAILSKYAHPAGADRIAALCYDQGDWKCAANFAQKKDGALSFWIKAKLAAQKGDLAGSQKLYAEAAKRFPTSDTLEDANKKVVLGESAVVTLARGEYVEALDRLMPVSGTYWPDVAYLAERVLTTDELKKYVDTHIPAVTVTKSDQPNAWQTSFNAHAALRDLLARRLMRDGRFDEAPAYFSDDKVRTGAKAYIASLTSAARSWSHVNEAEKLFAAASLARQSGMEILGAEGAPDYFYTGGDFDTGLGRPKLASAPLISKGEVERFTASAPKPDQRFHYRYLAIDEAMRAASLVPAKSQAFAAILCHAAAWSGRDPARAAAIWHRYVKEGARVPFAKSFGRQCPAPDFKAAAALERKLMWQAARRYVSHHRWWFAGGGAALLVLAGLGGFALWRRKTQR